MCVFLELELPSLSCLGLSTTTDMKSEEILPHNEDRDNMMSESEPLSVSSVLGSPSYVENQIQTSK